MKFGNDSSVTVANNGENPGMIAGANYGSMTQNQYGLGYSDTKALCLDIVQDELSKYRAEALIEAQKRNDELFQNLVRKLDDKQMSDAQALAEFRKPAMQFDYFEAQKAYMKAGTPELAEMLSNIVVERISESSRSLLQIALGEAIQVAPKLIPSQMATLALIFVVKYTIHTSVHSRETFVTYLRNTIVPLFLSGVSQKGSEFQHLCFTGCCQELLLQDNLLHILKNTYAGIFLKGFNGQDIPKDDEGNYLGDLYLDLFVGHCDDDKIYFNATNRGDLIKKLQARSAPQKHTDILLEMFDGNIMSDDDAQEFIETLVPEMKPVLEYWKNSNIENYSLSSVGIVIGAQYSHKIVGQNYNLKIWI